jgi:hypothetical protein
VTSIPTAGKIFVLALLLCGAARTLTGCTPRIEVAPPDKPITINLNIKIDHEIRVNIEQELKEVLSEKSGLF